MSIGAVVETYADDDGEGGGRFAALISPDLLVDGPNTVRVHRSGP